MDSQNISKGDCGCDDGCCTPQKKKSLLSKIIFLIITLAAVAIIMVKLFAKQDAPTEKCCGTETSTCCPQPKTEEK